MQINACDDDCGYCSLNEEVVLYDMCPGKYFVEITGFSELDYGDYNLALTCGGNETLSTNPGAVNVGFTENHTSGAYYALCGFIIVALCCLSVGISIITKNKKRRIAEREKQIEARDRLEYDSVDSDDCDDDMVVNESLAEGGEQDIDSEVERNILKYNVNGPAVANNDDPPVAFDNSVMSKIDENKKMEQKGEKSWAENDKKQKKNIPAPVSFELLHHEFNPSIIRKDNKNAKKDKEKAPINEDDIEAEAS